MEVWHTCSCVAQHFVGVNNSEIAMNLIFASLYDEIRLGDSADPDVTVAST